MKLGQSERVRPDTPAPLTPQPLPVAAHVALRLTGRLDVAALQGALTRLAAPREPAFAVLDLSGEPRGPRAAGEVVATILAEESLTGLDAAAPPAPRCWLVRIGADDHLLSMVLDRGLAALLPSLPLLYRGDGVPDAAAERAAVVPGALTERATAGGSAAANYAFAIPAETGRALRETGDRLRTTVPELVLATFAALIGVCGEWDHVTLGLPARGQILRLDLTGTPSLEDVLVRVRPGLTASPAADTCHLAFESTTAGESRHGAGRWTRGLRAALAYADTTPDDVDLAFVLHAGDHRLGGRFRYRTDAFHEAAADRLANYLITVLDAVAADTGRPFSRIPVVTTGGFHRLARQLPRQWTEPWKGGGPDDSTAGGRR
ncbi:hypothetical protein ACGFNP_09420 [Nonomuraea sp. NPDC049269]|uniref:hypothetical protein n=1 Tax=Nonomuraea sp. NPDC049269 TaxID=3364349 RepID=UPI003721C7D9